jgi:hypothetical protein
MNMATLVSTSKIAAALDVAPSVVASTAAAIGVTPKLVLDNVEYYAVEDSTQIGAKLAE